MGEVYLAYDPRLERTVALKVLPPELATDPRRMRRFVQEAKTTSSLNHPNLLTIYEIGQEGPLHFIATEFVDGMTLRDHMLTTQLRLNEILNIAIQVTQALASAHEAGVVHRDIKPENIMLRHRDQIAKVLDFGLAKVTEPFLDRGLSDPDAPTITLHQTEPSVILGTIRYMSPEQARGLQVDGRTDIWSVGVVLYEMLAHQSPFDGPTSSDLLVAILDRDPVPLSECAPDTPEELQRIVKRALTKDREKRYQTIKELAVELENLRLDLELDKQKRRTSSPSLSDLRRAEKQTTGEVARNATEVGLYSTLEVEQRTNPSQHLSGAAHIAVGIRQLNKTVLIGVPLIVLSLVAAYFYFARPSEVIDSIAVIPFVNADGDPNVEYLSDGITESLTDSISQLPGLSVIARSSVYRYKGREVNPQIVGNELKVKALLLGQIVQRGDRLVISAELVDARNNRRLWGGQYDRRLADILVVQSEISRQISEQLRVRLTSDQETRITKHHTENTEAYQDYLKGRFYWNKRTGEDLKKAIDHFNQAIAKDPRYALAYAGLADCYIVIPNYSDVSKHEAYVKAKEAALKALELDDSLAEAHTSVGGIKADFEWDFVGAETELRKALSLNPNYATARHWYAQYLSTMGRHAEAITEIKRAQELDPLSLIINSVVGDTYIKARQYDRAIEQLRRTIEMDKNFVRAHRYLATAYLEKGMFEEAIVEFDIAYQLAGEDRTRREGRTRALREAYANGGAQGFWRKQLEFIQQDQQQGRVSSYAVAAVYARLGEQDQSVRWLERAYSEHDPYVIYVNIDPEFDGLRSDPRVIDLMRRIGLRR